MPATIDDRGRVLIPKELREAIGLEPGQQVRIELDPDGGLRLQPTLGVDDFLDRLIGVVTAETRRQGAEPTDPLEVKRIWEPSP